MQALCFSAPDKTKVPPLRHVALTLALLLAGCAQFPELDDAITEESRNAPYPKLTALSQEPLTTATDSDAETQSILARTAALFARATALKNR